MATGILVIGESGAGKSTAVETLDPKTTFIINVASKPLPFKGWRSKYTMYSKDDPKGNMYYTDDADKIVACMTMVSEKMPQIKAIVIDDFQYASAFELFENLNVKGYDKWNVLAARVAMVAGTIRKGRHDLVVFVTNHAEESEDLEGKKKIKAKTLGKLIDKSLTLEGLFSVVLFAKIKKSVEGTLRYVFETQNNGENTCKSPKGMFKDFEIPNDFEYVRKAIEAYEV